MCMSILSRKKVQADIRLAQELLDKLVTNSGLEYNVIFVQL
jgi:hypothetical protein